VNSLSSNLCIFNQQKRAVKKVIAYLLPLLLFGGVPAVAQTFGLLQQFGGHSDFTFAGNTLNYQENEGNPAGACTIMTSSSAPLTLGAADNVLFARLYWAGSGNGTGDDVVQLNGQEVVATQTLTFSYNNLPAFCASADVTALVQASGAGTYTFSGLDLSDVINTLTYCENGVNFGGWALVVVFENPSLPINQVNVYDGLNGVPPQLTIVLDSLNVIDSQGAKIGFIAWEGDSALAVNERLTINNQVLSNALNPPTNAFNGTNSVTGATNLYNMDIDIYDIENNIQPGDATATVKLTSGQDFVMISTVVTKLNVMLPDATATIDSVDSECGSRQVTVSYTVRNEESTDVLPANMPVSVYADDVYLMTFFTTLDLAPDESESGVLTLDIPDTVADTFTLSLRVDEAASGAHTVTELSESNNLTTTTVTLRSFPVINEVALLESCNLGFSKGRFDFSTYPDLIRTRPEDSVRFFASEDAAIAGTPEILDASAYEVTTPATVWVRTETPQNCYVISSFPLAVRNCPPIVYNLVEPGENGYFDFMLTEGLHDIFLNYRLSIYNRWGVHVWTGYNTTDDFRGRANEGNGWLGRDLPGGTYFYLLELNDPDYPEPMTGFLYLKK